MLKKRSIILVEIDLDPVPGWNHFPEDMVDGIKHKLESWYNPKVTLLGVTDSEHPVKITPEKDDKSGVAFKLTV